MTNSRIKIKFLWILFRGRMKNFIELHPDVTKSYKFLKFSEFN